MACMYVSQRKEGSLMNSIDLRNEIWDYTRSITGYMGKLFKPIIDDTGLTMIQIRILLELHHTEEQTVGTIGKTIGLASGNASSMCKRLEKDGYIARCRDTLDERVVKLTLTASGIRMVREIEQAVSEKYDPYIQQQPQEELREIRCGMEKLLHLLQCLCELTPEDD